MLRLVSLKLEAVSVATYTRGVEKTASLDQVDDRHVTQPLQG